MPDSNSKLAIEIAVQTIIVLIGLSASIITITSTISKSSKKISVSCWEKTSWACMILSIAFGILSLLKIVGNIDSGKLDVYETFTSWFAGAQILLFGAGLFFLVLMAIKKQ